MNFDLHIPPAKAPVSDLFYLIVEHDDSYYDPPVGQRSIVVKPEEDAPFVYSRILVGNEGGALEKNARTKDGRFCDCSLNPKHVTSIYCKSVDVKLGDNQPKSELQWAFSEDSLPSILLLKQSLATELTARFRGLELFESVRGFGSDANGNFQVIPGALSEYRIPHGTGRLRRRGLAIQGKPSQCPYCEFEIIECPDCGVGGWSEFECPRCKKDLYRTAKMKPEGPNDKRLITDPAEQSPSGIWNGETWDGSDFVVGRISVGMMVTKRVVDYMFSTHATSFKAVPVVVDTEKMNAQQQKWMDEARKMPA